jgi:hypothetical protein
LIVRIRRAAIYDDIMENLRIRYVVTYVSPRPIADLTPRQVQVRLVDQSTGEAPRLVDASGRRVTARVIAEADQRQRRVRPAPAEQMRDSNYGVPPRENRPRAYIRGAGF